MNIDLNADGIPNRISVIDNEGKEVIRIRNASPDVIELATAIRDIALKRCGELKNYVNVDHINTCRSDKFEGADCVRIELMRLFGIKEEELK